MSTEKLTDEQAIEAWLVYLETNRGRLVRTIETYRAALMRLREFLAGKPLVDAEPDELEVFTGLWLHKKGVIARSRRPYISAVKGFYAWLHDKGHAGGNAADTLMHPKTGRPLPRAISLANAERLMWAPDLNTFVGIRNAAMLSLLIGCGLRVGGLVGLNQGDLQTVELECEPRLLLCTTEKGNRERRMPVPREAEALLRVYLGHEELAAIDRDVQGRGGRADKVLFVSVRSTLLAAHEHIGERRRLTRKAVHDVVQRYGKRLGIPAQELHPHAMRHLFGTELMEDDTHMLTMQHLLGHVDPKSTEIYVDLAMRKKVKAMDKAAPLAKMKTPVSELLKRLPK